MRSLAVLVGAILMMLVLLSGAAFFASAPDGAIRGPVVDDGSVR